MTGLQQLRWDDEDDEVPITSSVDETNQEDQSSSSYYLNMTSNKTDDGETIPLVNGDHHLIHQDSFPSFKSKPDTVEREDYLAPIVRA